VVAGCKLDGHASHQRRNLDAPPCATAGAAHKQRAALQLGNQPGAFAFAASELLHITPPVTRLAFC
jgi:hypothetical protein